MVIEIEEIYERYGPMVLRRCRRLLGEGDEASDAMHDVFVQVIRRQEKLVLTSPSSLLYKMATDICLNRIRTKVRHPETRDERLLNMIAHDENLESMTEIRSLLGQLFKQEETSTRTMAVLHYVDRMTLEQVAEMVGLSVSGVRKRLRVFQQKSKAFMEATA